MVVYVNGEPNYIHDISLSSESEAWKRLTQTQVDIILNPINICFVMKLNLSCSRNLF